MNSLERLKEEYKDLCSRPLSNLGIAVGLSDQDNWYEWNFSLIGAKDSPYAGGLFQMKLSFPKDYPSKAPDIIFLTPIYHLNVNPKFPKYYEGCELLGHVSVSFINWWRPETTVREILTKLYSIFYWLNPDSGFGIDRAEEYKENRSLFELKAKYFTRKYANPMKATKIDDKDWDFNYNEKDLEAFKLKIQKENEKIDDIILIFSDNGRRTTPIKCGINELMRDVIQRCLNIFGISKNLEEILFISTYRRLNLNSSVKDNGLNDKSRIEIIYDVIFA